tara:strand:+ start:868 stop:1311 length:444 start_codon:yes stop_codon:yes gene_type:complete
MNVQKINSFACELTCPEETKQLKLLQEEVQRLTSLVTNLHATISLLQKSLPITFKLRRGDDEGGYFIYLDWKGHEILVTFTSDHTSVSTKLKFTSQHSKFKKRPSGIDYVQYNQLLATEREAFKQRPNDDVLVFFAKQFLPMSLKKV